MACMVTRAQAAPKLEVVDEPAALEAWADWKQLQRRLPVGMVMAKKDEVAAKGATETHVEA